MKKSKWNRKFNIETREGSLSCPNCNVIFDEQIIYFFDPTICQKCRTSIGFISVSPYDKVVYVLDLNEVPEVFEVMFDYLSKKSHKEGFNQMKELIQLFKD
ncbi:hypothetical protein [Tenacibaculum ovolyticum]|uniref:hypothetical protein n=1 Tax=Tenacibaculum ovolyticum TaxID=104270 RepID=UPI003BAB8248